MNRFVLEQFRAAILGKQRTEVRIRVQQADGLMSCGAPGRAVAADGCGRNVVDLRWNEVQKPFRGVRAPTGLLRPVASPACVSGASAPTFAWGCLRSTGCLPVAVKFQTRRPASQEDRPGIRFPSRR